MKQTTEKKTLSSGRVFYLDFLRVAAMFAVIVLHTAAKDFGAVGLHNPQWYHINLYESLVRWAVPVFTMVSGTMFLDNARELPLKKLFGKYLLRIVIAFTVWSTLYYFSTVLFGNVEFSLRTCAATIIRGHYHLWFLYMIAGLYLVTPLLRKITADKKATVYFLVIAFAFAFIVPTAIKCLKLFGARSYDTLSSVINDKLLLKLVLGYSPYFVAGYYLHNTEISRKAETVIYILGAIGFASTWLLTDLVSNRYNEAMDPFYSYYCINVLFESIAVFVFAKNRVSRIGNAGFKNLIFKAAKLSFGVYLVHAMFLIVITKFLIDPASFTTAVSIPAVSFAIFVGSIIVSFVLNKIPVVNRYLV